MWTFRPNELNPLGDGVWDRAQARSLRRRLYVLGLDSFVRREANRTLKDARDLATRAVMHAPTWVRSLSIHFPDSVSTWWYQVRAYGLNYWFGGTNLCPFCRAAGEVDRARLAIRPTHFGICHHSVLRASHLKVHNAVVALIGAEIRLGDLSDAFLRSTVRPVTASGDM